MPFSKLLKTVRFRYSVACRDAYKAVLSLQSCVGNMPILTLIDRNQGTGKAEFSMRALRAQADDTHYVDRATRYALADKLQAKPTTRG